jgi:hypothetical protein
VNGVRQELAVTPSGDASILKGLLVRDWPLVIRFLDR